MAQDSLPDTGSTGNVTANNRIRISAKKKFGSACPTTASARQPRSIQLLGCVAAAMPSGIEIASAKASENSASNAVVGSLSRTRASTSVLK